MRLGFDNPFKCNLNLDKLLDKQARVGRKAQLEIHILQFIAPEILTRLHVEKSRIAMRNIVKDNFPKIHVANEIMMVPA